MTIIISYIHIFSKKQGLLNLILQRIQMTDIPEGDFVDLERNNGGVCSPSSGSISSTSTSRPIDMVTFIDIIILLKTETINGSIILFFFRSLLQQPWPPLYRQPLKLQVNDIPGQNMLMISRSTRSMKVPCTFLYPP